MYFRLIPRSKQRNPKLEWCKRTTLGWGMTKKTIKLDQKLEIVSVWHIYGYNSAQGNHFVLIFFVEPQFSICNSGYQYCQGLIQKNHPQKAGWKPSKAISNGDFVQNPFYSRILFNWILTPELSFFGSAISLILFEHHPRQHCHQPPNCQAEGGGLRVNNRPGPPWVLQT